MSGPVQSVSAIASQTWRERDGILWSRALEQRGVVAGFTARPLGSMGGNETPQEEARTARAALAQRLAFDHVVRVRQVHGDAVLRADGPFEPWPEADALWTDRIGVLLGVVAADCVPMLVTDGRRIGAAHAGWEGTSRRVAVRLVEALVAAGADPDEMTASIGPSIGPCCYGVDDARAATIRERLGALAEATLPRLEGGLAFDLWRANSLQLQRAGVREIEVAGICTKDGGYDLWSRRAGHIGRLGLGFIGRRA